MVVVSAFLHRSPCISCVQDTFLLLYSGLYHLLTQSVFVHSLPASPELGWLMRGAKGDDWIWIMPFLHHPFPQHIPQTNPNWFVHAPPTIILFWMLHWQNFLLRNCCTLFFLQNKNIMHYAEHIVYFKVNLILKWQFLPCLRFHNSLYQYNLLLFWTLKL